MNKYEELSFTDDFMFCKVLKRTQSCVTNCWSLLSEKRLEHLRGSINRNRLRLRRMEKESGLTCTARTTKMLSMTARCRLICLFDEFKAGLHKYTFKTCCEELPEITLEDEATKIFLCAGGDADDVSPEMKEFLEWMVSGRQGKTELVRKLDDAVQKAKNHEEWRLEYMTLLMRDNKMREEGRKEGRENEIFLSVQEGDYKPKRGAEKLGITEDEFMKRMNAAGYKI